MRTFLGDVSKAPTKPLTRRLGFLRRAIDALGADLGSLELPVACLPSNMCQGDASQNASFNSTDTTEFAVNRAGQ